jgi:photosystem II stability/assembly factor-like uncharacterized protein
MPGENEEAPGSGDQRLTPSQERAKFEPVAVHGTSAADRQKAYEARLRAEELSPFSQIKWRNVGPERQGGRIIEIAAPMGDPKSLYVAYATGGLYRSMDEGSTWTSLFDGQASFGIGAFAASRDGKTLWIGSGEANSQRTSYAGDGVYKSTDSGKSWVNVGLPESQHIAKIVIDPKNENVVWVAAMGHLYSQNPERGVYKTTDGGRTWAQVLKVDEFTGAIDLVMDPTHPDHVMASMWDRDRRAWDFRMSGRGSGVYRTLNGGRTWALCPSVPSGEIAGRMGLANCASHPSTVYALVDNQGDDSDWDVVDEHVPSGRLTPRRFLLLTDETLPQVDEKVLGEFLRRYPAGSLSADDTVKQVKAKKLSLKDLRIRLEVKNPQMFKPDQAGPEVYRSDDFGLTWHRVPRGKLGGFGGDYNYYFGKLWVSPDDPDNLFAGGLRLLHSRDGGKTWHLAMPNMHWDMHALWMDPANLKHVWAGNDGGLYVSHDGGDTGHDSNNLDIGQATTLALDDASPYRIYIGLQDNGTMRGPSNYKPGQSDPSEWEDLFGGDGATVAVDPRGNDRIYVSFQFGGSYAINKKTGDFTDTQPHEPKGDPAARFNWITPFIISPHSPEVLYEGAQRVYRSLDEGKHWTPISPDITKNLPNGNVPYSTVTQLSESPFSFGLLYAGCDDGTVKMTPDGGYQWVDISTPEPKKWVSRLVASKWDKATVYCAQSGYREDDFRPLLWKSVDFGKTWKSIVGDLPSETINVIREDPTHKDMLFVGTDMGAYVSLDGGAHWEPLQGGIPHLPVHDLAIQAREGDLVAATHARSAWIMPLKWVYVLTPEIRRADLTVFEVDDVDKSARWGYDDRDTWDTSALPSRVAHVAFYSFGPGAAVVRVKGADGKVVKEQKLSAARGFNFVDLSLETKAWAPGTVDPRKRQVKTAADALKDPYEAERPQYLPAGSYTIEVSVNGHTASKPFKVNGE